MREKYGLIAMRDRFGIWNWYAKVDGLNIAGLVEASTESEAISQGEIWLNRNIINREKQL